MKKVAGLIAAGALGADILVGGCASGPVSCAPYEQMVGEPQPTLDARIHALSRAIMACYNAMPGSNRNDRGSSFGAAIDVNLPDGDLLKIATGTFSTTTERSASDFAEKTDDVSMSLLEGQDNTLVKYTIELDANRGGMIWGTSSNKETGFVKYRTITAGNLDAQGLHTANAHVEADPYDGGGTYIVDDAATVACVEQQLFSDAKSVLRATAGNVLPSIAEPSVTGACALS
ncbi:MAG TPA: hypothetical protein VLG11_01645 [Candidatus Saccharimonadales bacterium]|nr:hypothetical protein [Candidatus Saccharimonadales bacterium]